MSVCGVRARVTKTYNRKETNTIVPSDGVMGCVEKVINGEAQHGLIRLTLKKVGCHDFAWQET